MIATTTKTPRYTPPKTHVFKCNITNRGFYALWECGGWDTESECGQATIIANQHGGRLTPICELDSGNRHALFVVQPGYFVVQAWVKANGRLNTRIWKIEELKDGSALCSIVPDSAERPELLLNALEAVIEKAECENCECIHYTSKQRREDDEW